MVDDIDDILDEVADGPRRVSGDEGSVEQHSIPDLIELAKYKASSSAVGSSGRPKINICKLIPPGSV